MQRACAAALLHQGQSELLSPGRSNDDLAAMDVITKLGADITDLGNRLLIKSSGVAPRERTISCGESGLGIRMFTPVAALSDRELEISGTGSLVSRPMHFFDEIFPRLGISIRSSQGRLPLVIKGPLRPASVEVDGSLSSQFLTGMLMAFSAARASDVTLTVRNLTSRPYIDLTLDVMRAFGMHLPVVERYETFYFPVPLQAPDHSTVTYRVEGDWSGGAFLLVAGALSGPVTVKGLDLQSAQADKAILEALELTGSEIRFDAGTMCIAPGHLRPFQFDATECPDLFPPLAALAAACKGVSVISGAHRLTHKESNRALTLQEEFGKLGITVTLDGDLMKINGGTGIKAATVHSHHDHRIAMATAIAASLADGPVTILDAEAVAKSYPRFYEDLGSLGSVMLTGAGNVTGQAAHH
jgi:3-phosphoshikimate 1-carboxyvinyltransferase